MRALIACSLLSALMPSVALAQTVTAVPIDRTHPARFVGEYDGGQTELAARLRLGADGRFAYALAYGALDEETTGRWEFDGTRVLLNSDPVRAPAWVLVAQHPLAERELRIALDLPLEISPQYFNARV